MRSSERFLLAIAAVLCSRFLGAPVCFFILSFSFVRAITRLSNRVMTAIEAILSYREQEGVSLAVLGCKLEDGPAESAG